MLIAAGVAFVFSILVTPALIGALRAREIGQHIRQDGPRGHIDKAGTPTMGGIAIVGGAALGYVVSHVRVGTIFTRGGLLAMFVVVGAGLVGLADDWIIVVRERSLGLNKRMKMGGLIVVAIVFAVLAVRWANVDTRLGFTRADGIGWDLGALGWIVLAIVVIVASSNAVNLTDGLDGLAAGSSLLAFAAYVVVGFWAFRHFEVYQVPQALDLALVAAAMLGSLAGFLWWNAAPAQIFMGDTGSLSIGAGLGALALMTKTELLLPIIGTLFVVETLSVIVQVVSFRAFGRRVFRMAPIHHHFELRGWPETTVLIRFWIVSGIAVGVALGLFYADFIAVGGID
ncbi:MAG TPA: phospho-N-acetylmuramoyl-pentapeptide-transferase [Acidimicrobiales bacterium]